MIRGSMLVAVLAVAATPAAARENPRGHAVVTSRSVEAGRPFAAWLERQGISHRAVERTRTPVTAGAGAPEVGRHAAWLARHVVPPRPTGKRGVAITAGGNGTSRWAPWLARHGIVPTKRG